MEYVKLYDRIKPDEYLTIREVYARSKKDDDFEKASTKYTYIYTGVRVGRPSQRDHKVEKAREKRVAICRRIWRGIKVSFFINPISPWFETYLNTVRRLLDLRVQELNEEFVRIQDTDVMECPNPTDEQRVKLEILNRLLRFAMGQS